MIPPRWSNRAPPAVVEGGCRATKHVRRRLVTAHADLATSVIHPGHRYCSSRLGWVGLRDCGSDAGTGPPVRGIRPFRPASPPLISGRFPDRGSKMAYIAADGPRSPERSAIVGGKSEHKGRFTAVARVVPRLDPQSWPSQSYGRRAFHGIRASGQDFRRELGSR